LSIFPLFAITLSNNIYAILPIRWTKNGNNKILKIALRFLSSLPPLLLGSFLRPPSPVLGVTELCGLYIGFIIPALLQIRSKYVCQKAWGLTATPYTFHFSHSTYCVFMIIFTLGVIGWTLFQIVKT